MTNKYTKAKRIADFYKMFQDMGFTYDEVETLRLAQLTLHRWSERECNGEVEIDEETDKAYSVYYRNNGEAIKHRIPNSDKGARERVEKIIKNHEGYQAYFQGDPRGCALYILRPSDLKEGQEVDSYYSRGIAVCI